MFLDLNGAPSLQRLGPFGEPKTPVPLWPSMPRSHCQTREKLTHRLERDFALHEITANRLCFVTGSLHTPPRENGDCKGPLPYFKRRTLIGWGLIFTEFVDQSAETKKSMPIYGHTMSRQGFWRGIRVWRDESKLGLYENEPWINFLETLLHVNLKVHLSTHLVTMAVFCRVLFSQGVCANFLCLVNFLCMPCAWQCLQCESSSLRKAGISHFLDFLLLLAIFIQHLFF